ncbi:hypothetical protein [Petroclostridium sp. X23]|uniref:capping complex subunit for YIEGIA n=1 Tax=Petroclostridium sp. X23 TaxID=3045146 RepID=UPI0024AE30F8|nr:hypothetical protein [Petroclostridium sp. X23]WHH59869.1 hypothetical protein QKW49_03735 [Petroclostridium sp. X23]
MGIDIQNIIVAVVTHHRDKVQSGFAPVFYSEDESESEKLALYLAKVTMGMAHNLENGVYVIVKH